MRIRVYIGLVSLCLLALASLPVLGQRNLARNQVDSIIRNLETSSDVFSRDFQRRNTTANERRIVNNFENAIDRLRRNFDRNDNWWDTRNDVQSIMDESRQVNQLMNGERFARSLEVQWRNLRRDINALANTFELTGLAGGNTGPFPGGGGQTSRPPSWAQGTFYSTNSGDNITLSIDNRGRVTVVNNGQTFYGTFDRNQIFVNGDLSDISRSGNGVRTYNRSSGITTIYSRNDLGGVGDGNVSRPPNWAVGTFYSINGTGITLTINGDGRVTVINGGQTYYGTFYNNTITVNGDTSTLTQTRRGISTYNRNLGQTTEYRRQ